MELKTNQTTHRAAFGKWDAALAAEDNKEMCNLLVKNGLRDASMNTSQQWVTINVNSLLN